MAPGPPHSRDGAQAPLNVAKARIAAAGDPRRRDRWGTIEVTARLVEIPEGAIFERELYDYATVLKYQVSQVHRGTVEGRRRSTSATTIPSSPASEAADKQVQDVGGNLKPFRAGQVHRMALEESMDDHYMGGIVNKYFGKDTGPTYWAVWTNLVSAT